MADNQNPRHPANKKKADARREARRAAREAVMSLLFETEYHEGETPDEIYRRAADARELENEERAAYIRATYMGVMQSLPTIDALIGRHATGWRTGRLSRVSRAILRLGAYELAFDDKTPAAIAINEAVELSKKFDAPRARGFINGVLNAVKDELTECGGLPAGLAVEAPTPVVGPAGETPAVEPVKDDEPSASTVSTVSNHENA